MKMIVGAAESQTFCLKGNILRACCGKQYSEKHKWNMQNAYRYMQNQILEAFGIIRALFAVVVSAARISLKSILRNIILKLSFF